MQVHCDMWTLKMITRRKAIRLLSLSPLVASLLYASKSSPSPRILIIGGGTGAITILTKLSKIFHNPKITIIAPNEKHIYQPGQVYVAAGVYETDEIIKNNSNYIPKDVIWIKDKVKSYAPQMNSITTQDGQTVEYDYLIVATGLEYHYEWIKGLHKEDIGTKNIASVYLNDTDKGTAKGGSSTLKWFESIQEEAKNKDIHILYTMPNTPVKCGAVAQKMAYLTADYLQKHSLSAKLTYTTNSKRLFGLKDVDKRLHLVQKEYLSLQTKFRHNLIEIDTKKKIATYQHKYEIKTGWDPDFQEWESITKKTEIVKMHYDYIHIVPPMSATKDIRESELAVEDGHFKGWLDVDLETLQHSKYPNIFGIGDICGTPLGKTVATVAAQALIIEKNLLSVITKTKLIEKFTGYSVCPIKVAFGKIILVEFDYQGLVENTKMSQLSSESLWKYDLYETKKEYWATLLKGHA
jgi:sulfide:quinone oxidoreductase